MNLSRSFTLNEFCRSQEAARLDRPIYPTEDQLRNMQRLCAEVLQPFRDALLKPVVITSGLRPEWLNKLVGGSATSAHFDGRAADIIVPGMKPPAVCKFIQTLKLPIDQVINEYPPNGWCHVGIARLGETPRNQFLTASRERGKTIYTEWT